MSRLFPSRAAVALAFVLTSLPAASAHELAKGPNGGPVADAAGHHIEFVSSATDVTFFLTAEKDEPIASAGAKMKAIIQDAGKTTQVELSPAEPNKLVGKIAAALAAGVATAFASSQLRPVFDSASEVRAKTGLPLLGVVSLVIGNDDARSERKDVYRFVAGSGSLIALFVAGLIVTAIIASRQVAL